MGWAFSLKSATWGQYMHAIIINFTCMLTVSPQDGGGDIDWSAVELAANPQRPLKRQRSWAVRACILLSLPVVISCVFFGLIYLRMEQATGNIYDETLITYTMGQRAVRTCSTACNPSTPRHSFRVHARLNFLSCHLCGVWERRCRWRDPEATRTRYMFSWSPWYAADADRVP